MNTPRSTSLAAARTAHAACSQPVPPRISHLLVVLLLVPTAAAAPSLLTDRDRELCAQRRQAVIEAMEPGDLVVVRSGEAAPGPVGGFYRDRDFLYLVGHAEEAMQLVLERPIEGEGRVTLFLRERNPGRELWDGWRLSPGEEAVGLIGIPDIRPLGELRAALTLAAASARRIFHNQERPRAGDAPSGVTAVLEASFTGEDREEASRPRRPSALTSRLRQVKAPEEIVKLERSIAITCSSLSRTIARIRPGLMEYQVQAMIESGFAWEGAEGLGFRSIVGAGINGTTLHYSANRDSIADGDLIVMDVGAEFMGYSADVTRTVPANGRYSPRQRELYEIVLSAQRAGFDAVRPGNTIADVHAAAKGVIEAAGYGEHFPHGTSHWLGLDVHDVGIREMPLAPGMVLTVEPGIYLPGEGIGIRIEDDVLVTEDGHRILSAGVPREADEIEALMAGRSR